MGLGLPGVLVGGIIACPPPACTASALGTVLPPPFLAGLRGLRLSCWSQPVPSPLLAPAKEGVLILHCGFLKVLVVPLRAALPVPACSPACPCLRCRLPGAREANRRKPSPGAKPVLAIFREPFLEQHRLNPARTLAKERGLFKTACLKP